MFSYNLLMASLIRRLYSFKVKFPSEKSGKKEKPKKKKDKDDGDEGGDTNGDDSDLYDDEKTRKAKQLKADELERKKTGKDTLIN